MIKDIIFAIKWYVGVILMMSVLLGIVLSLADTREDKRIGTCGSFSRIEKVLGITPIACWLSEKK